MGQTIRVENCRGDGRCPVCGASASTRFPLSMPCGCAGCAWPGCAAAHLHALLTEALRQLSEQRERGDQAEARAFEVAEQREMVRNERDQEEALARRHREERDSAIRELNNAFKARDAAIRELSALWATPSSRKSSRRSGSRSSRRKRA